MSGGMLAVGRVCLVFFLFSLHTLIFFMKGPLSFLHIHHWGEGLYLEVLDGSKKSLQYCVVPWCLFVCSVCGSVALPKTC